MVTDKLLYVLLDTIRETCARRETCSGCALADDGDCCCIATFPEHWQTGILEYNLEKRAESEA